VSKPGKDIEEILIDPIELMGFETTEFAAEDYAEIVQDVDGGLIFKPRRG